MARDLADAVTGQMEPDLALAAAEPPPRTKNAISVADSVEAFLQLLYSLPANESTETFFRGHKDERYELTPSLLRKWPDERGSSCRTSTGSVRNCSLPTTTNFDVFGACERESRYRRLSICATGGQSLADRARERFDELGSPQRPSGADRILKLSSRARVFRLSYLPFHYRFPRDRFPLTPAESGQ